MDALRPHSPLLSGRRRFHDPDRDRRRPGTGDSARALHLPVDRELCAIAASWNDLTPLLAQGDFKRAITMTSSRTRRSARSSTSDTLAHSVGEGAATTSDGDGRAWWTSCRGSVAHALPRARSPTSRRCCSGLLGTVSGLIHACAGAVRRPREPGREGQPARRLQYLGGDELHRVRPDGRRAARAAATRCVADQRRSELVAPARRWRRMVLNQHHRAARRSPRRTHRRPARSRHPVMYSARQARARLIRRHAPRTHAPDAPTELPSCR